MHYKSYATAFMLLLFSYFQCNYMQAFTSEFIKGSTTNNNISVSVGNIFTLELNTNPSTGFAWQFSQAVDPQYLQLIEHIYIQGKKNVPGAPGKDLWKFKALKPGTTTFALKYVRPWEKATVNKVSHTNIQKYTVKIEK